MAPAAISAFDATPNKPFSRNAISYLETFEAAAGCAVRVAEANLAQDAIKAKQRLRGSDDRTVRR